MVIAIDFDGVVVDAQASHDLSSPLTLKAGAREGLESLRRAGHVLLLYSARANLAQREDPQLDPLVRAGKRRVRSQTAGEQRVAAEARYRAMLDFIGRELPGVFDAVDDGRQGKPIVDIFIDDHAVRLGPGVLGVGWRGITEMYGQPVYGGRRRSA